MKSKRNISDLIIATSIGITSVMLLTNIQKSVSVQAEPVEIKTAIYNAVEPKIEVESELVPLEEIIVDVPNIEPVSSILYDIQLSEVEQQQIFDITNAFGIDYELVLAIIKTESEFNPSMIGDNGNSFGLMQIQPRWWTKLFNEYGCSDWFSVHDNVTTGCAILQYLYGSYGETVKVLNVYNTGNPNRYNGYSDKVLSNLVEIHKLKR